MVWAQRGGARQPVWVGLVVLALLLSSNLVALRGVSMQTASQGPVLPTAASPHTHAPTSKPKPPPHRHLEQCQLCFAQLLGGEPVQPLQSVFANLRFVQVLRPAQALPKNPLRVLQAARGPPIVAA